ASTPSLLIRRQPSTSAMPVKKGTGQRPAARPGKARLLWGPLVPRTTTLLPTKRDSVATWFSLAFVWVVTTGAVAGDGAWILGWRGLRMAGANRPSSADRSLG